MPTEKSVFEELFQEAAQINYPKTGDLIEGTVLSVEGRVIIVDVNGQFTGIVSGKELGSSVDLNSVKAGDKVEAIVLWDSESKGLIILSLKRANQIKSLTNLNKYYESKEIIKVVPNEANKWGLLVDIDGLKWFIPVSQLTPIHYPRVEGADPEKILEHLEGLVGEEFTVRVINVDENGKKIIFSEKAAIEEKRGEALKSLKIGDTVEWVVSGILTYGLFITFDWLEGLVHVSEIDWGHVNNPSKFAKVGQKVKVMVIGMDEDKISLSMKRLQENPWDVLAKKYKLGDVVKAPVSRIAQFGAFLELVGGIQGLIHLSEISHGVVKDIKDFITVGETIEAKIINFEPKAKRIGLSLKALQEKPAPKKAPAKKDEAKADDKKVEKKETKKAAPKKEAKAEDKKEVKAEKKAPAKKTEAKKETKKTEEK